ncbi:MAG: small multi-drug export protein [Candidatus Saliniplasma sp.]
MEEDKEKNGFFTTLPGKIVMFFLPFLIASLYISLLYIIIHEKSIFWIASGGMFGYFFPPAGKESVIPLAVGAINAKGVLSPITTILLVAGSIAYVDIVTSYFLLWNFYIAEKIPLIGTWIKKFEKFGAQKMKEKKWISKVAFIGVVLFVVFPFQGSGGVGASIVGRVIGLDKYKTWLAIIIGSFTGCTFIAVVSLYLSDAILEAFQTSVFQGIGTLIIVGIIFILIYYVSKNHMKNSKRKKSEIGEQDEIKG